MKKTFKFFAAALAIVAAASCAKEINVDTPADDSAEKVYMTFTASYDAEGETKTVLADGNKVHWSDTDAIRIFGKKKNDSSYGFYLSDTAYEIDPASNDENPTFAVFSGTGVPYYQNYAVLPANGWEAYSNNMRFSNGLSSQVAVAGSFDPSKHIAVSTETTGTHFSFYNGCALLKVKVGSDGIYSIKVDGTESNTGAGIGMTFQFTPGNVESLIMKSMYGYNPSIVLSNSDSSKALESGATYYIVVPYATFNNFKVAICDANGEEMISKSKASAFNIERNKVYDLGTFEKPNESIEVSTTSLSIAASNGSASFKVVANANWTVTTSADWLSVSPSTGGATSGTTVTVTAAENTSDAARTATITVKGAFVSKTISVTQAKRKTYKVNKRVEKTTDLVGGTKYIIRLHSNEDYVWTNANGKLECKFVYPYVYTESEVFTFNVTGSASNTSNYKSKKAGRFISLKTNMLIGSDLNINITESNLTAAQIFCLCSQWGTETGFDFDIYQNGTSTTLYRNGTWMGWTTDGGNNANRKWAIYTVSEN